MIISLINHTNGQISDEEIQTAIRAINRQIAEDLWDETDVPGALGQ